MLGCVVKAVRYENKNRYLLYRRFEDGDDKFDKKILNLADAWSLSPCVINLLLRIVESGSTLALLLVHQTYNLSRIKFAHVSRQVDCLCIS